MCLFCLFHFCWKWVLSLGIEGIPDHRPKCAIEWRKEDPIKRTVIKGRGNYFFSNTRDWPLETSLFRQQHFHLHLDYISWYAFITFCTLWWWVVTDFWSCLLSSDSWKQPLSLGSATWTFDKAPASGKFWYSLAGSIQDHLQGVDILASTRTNIFLGVKEGE